MLKPRINYFTFAQRCRTARRYVRDEDCEQLLSILRDTAASRELWLESDHKLHRAQVGFDWGFTGAYGEDGEKIELEVPYEAPRMKPLEDGSREGRINPKGIPVLYLASDVETAVAEVRPCKDARVSVSKFKLTRRVRVVDCTVGHDAGHFAVPFGELHGPTPESVWIALDQAFAEPVQESDTSADYAPTQTVAELFRSADFDGVKFKSSVGDGFSYALFDTALAKPVAGALLVVQDITYEVKPSHGSGWSMA